MKVLILISVLVFGGIPEAKEFYSLRRFEDCLTSLNGVETLEANSLRAFCLFELKRYDDLKNLQNSLSENKSDSMIVLLTKNYLAIENPLEAKRLIDQSSSSLNPEEKNNLDKQINQMLDKQEKLLSKSLGMKGVCLGVAQGNGGIIYARDNKLYLNDRLIYSSEGKYVGSPFVRDNKILFVSNEFTAGEVKINETREVSKKSISTLQLYIGDLTEDKVTNVKKYRFSNVEYDFISPFMDEEKNIYFSSNMPGGQGGYDVYISRFLNGNYQAPVNIGKPLNTPFDDLYYRRYNDRVYITSSNKGYGSLDLFVTLVNNEDGEERYLDLVNFGSKSNTGRSEYSFFKSGTSGYFISNVSPGEDELRIIDKLDLNRLVKVDAINKLTGDTIQINLIETYYANGLKRNSIYPVKDSIYSVDYNVDDLFPNQIIIGSEGYTGTTRKSEQIKSETVELMPNWYGTVTDNITRDPIEGVKVFLLEFGDTVASSTTGKDGSWYIPHDNSSEYDVVYEYPGYQKTGWRFPETPITIGSKLGMSIENKKGNILKIRNIYFELAKADLKEEGKDVLDRIHEYMLQNPTCRIELSAHTDSRGSSSSNLSLSKQRAKSAFDYLITKGISEKRLIPVGYGEIRLINNCKDGVSCDESEHSLNRRVEMKIL